MEIKVKHISDVIARQFVVSDVAVLEIPNLEPFEGLWKSATGAKTRISELKSNSFS